MSSLRAVSLCSLFPACLGLQHVFSLCEGEQSFCRNSFTRGSRREMGAGQGWVGVTSKDWSYKFSICWSTWALHHTSLHHESLETHLDITFIALNIIFIATKILARLVGRTKVFTDWWFREVIRRERFQQPQVILIKGRWAWFFLHKYINMYSKYMSQLDTIHCDQVPYHLTNSSTQHSGGEKKILGSYKYQQIL